MWPRVTRSLAAYFVSLPSAAVVITYGKATAEADPRKKPRRVKSLVAIVLSVENRLIVVTS